MSAKFKNLQMDLLNIRKWTGDIYKDKDSRLMISPLNEKNCSKWSSLIIKKKKDKKYVSFIGSHFHDLISGNLTRIQLLSERYLQLKHKFTCN